MKRRSPTIEGFRVILRRPSFGLAEMTWRWCFGGATLALFGYGFVEYLDTLSVTPTDILLFRSRQPVLISRAIGHILSGSAPRAVATFILLSFSLAVLWIVVNSLGRIATTRALVDYFRNLEPGPSPKPSAPASGRISPLLGLSFLRVAAALAAALGCIAAFLSAGVVSDPTDPSPGSAFLIFLSVLMLVWLAWSTLNWFLSLAAVFVVADGQDTFGALISSLDLCRNEGGSIFAAGFWFGLAHLTAFIVATSAVAFPLGLAQFLPGTVTLGGVLLVTLIYFAIVDFLYAGRLAAYVAILELPDAPVPEPPPPILPPTYTIDRDEPILSDLPATAG
jgi:hypothetical protein